MVACGASSRESSPDPLTEILKANTPTTNINADTGTYPYTDSSPDCSYIAPRLLCWDNCILATRLVFGGFPWPLETDHHNDHWSSNRDRTMNTLPPNRYQDCVCGSWEKKTAALSGQPGPQQHAIIDNVPRRRQSYELASMQGSAQAHTHESRQRRVTHQHHQSSECTSTHICK